MQKATQQKVEAAQLEAFRPSPDQMERLMILAQSSESGARTALRMVQELHDAGICDAFTAIRRASDQVERIALRKLRQASLAKALRK